MYQVQTTAIWALVVVIVVLLIWVRLGQPVRQLILASKASVEQRQVAARIKNENDQLALEAAKKQAAIDASLEEEVRSLRQAELRRQTAEIDAQTQIAAALSEDRLVAERRVLEVRTALRLEQARTEPLPMARPPKTLSALISGYNTYRRYVESAGAMIFLDWLADTRWLDLEPKTVESLVAMYEKYTHSNGYQATTHLQKTFDTWMGGYEAFVSSGRRTEG